MKTAFTTEAELCDALAQVAPGDGWDVFPEVGGFDLVLVWNGSRAAPGVYGSASVPLVEPGWQLGIDAKMRANVDVLEQCAFRMDQSARPDCGAVLVPEASDAFRAVARRLGLLVFTAQHCVARNPGSVYMRDRRHIVEPGSPPSVVWRAERKPLALPPVPLQGSGGQASPRVLSPWRVSALRCCIALRARGSLTRAEGKAIGIDLSDWLQRGWVLSDGGRPARYTLNPTPPSRGPESGYERERDAIAAKDAEIRGAA
jgi:hypothetical protein